MDDVLFQEARQAYDAGDFRTAARLFAASAGPGSDGNGSAYHMAGNSLLRLRRYGDALSMYRHALEDEVYLRRGAVHANAGAAHTSLGAYDAAIAEYSAALSEPGYSTPYKALQGTASALLEMGRLDEAAASYRRAALDEGNPNPGAALVNLGLCLMALGRPADAVDAYQAALGFDSYKARGKALANLGQAYHALGRHAEAVRSFDKAVNLHSHTLSASALADYDASLVAQGAAASGDGGQGASTADETPAAEQVASAAAPPEGASAPSEAPPTDTFEITGASPAVAPDASEGRQGSDPGSATAAGNIAEEDEVLAFLNRTDEEMRQADREMRQAARAARREDRSLWRTAIVVGVAVVLLVGVLVGLFYGGYGWPTQEGTTEGLLEAHKAGDSVTAYWVAVPTKDVKKEMAKVPPMTAFTIDSVERGSSESTANVTVTPSSGAPLRYRVSLQREGVGWKVIGIENDWGSAGGS